MTENKDGHKIESPNKKINQKSPRKHVRRMTRMGEANFIQGQGESNLVETIFVELEGDFDYEALIDRLNAACSHFSRFRSKVVHPNFVEIEDFDARSVVSVRDVSKSMYNENTEEGLKDFLQSLHCGELGDPDLPLWRCHIIKCFEQDPKRTIVVVACHHSIGDGTSLNMFNEKLMDPIPNMPEPEPVKIKSLRKRLTELLMFLIYVYLGFFGVLIKLIRISLRKPNKAFAVKFSKKKSVAWLKTPLDLEDFHSMRKKYGASLNEMINICIVGGIRRYLEKQRKKLPKNILTCQPADLRSKGEVYFGNRFGFFLLDVPVTDTATALKILKIRSRNVKASPEKWVNFWISKFTTLFPYLLSKPLLELGSSFVDVAITNVKGPPIQLKICGLKAVRLLGALNLPPGVPLGYIVYSYGGKLYVSVCSYDTFCPDASILMDGLVKEYTLMKAISERNPESSAESEEND